MERIQRQIASGRINEEQAEQQRGGNEQIRALHEVRNSDWRRSFGYRNGFCILRVLPNW